MTAQYIVGLGSNLGSREAHIEAGSMLIAALPQCALLARSPLYQSAPVGPPQPDYLNGALRVRSELTPHALLAQLLAIEASLGRVRDRRWGPRTLDLDILWTASAVHTDALTIPHPRLHERWFALAPLLDVAPELTAVYEPSLRALIAASPPVWEPSNRLHVSESRGRLLIETVGSGPEAALAAALTELGRRSALHVARPAPHASRPANEVMAIRAACTSSSAARELAQQAVETLRQGGSFHFATVGELGASGCEGRLFGERSGDAARGLRLEELQLSADGAQTRLTLAVTTAAP